MRTEVNLAQKPLVVWWFISESLAIREVYPGDKWPDHETELAFVNVVGRSTEDRCATAAELIGAEVIAIATHSLRQMRD